MFFTHPNRKSLAVWFMICNKRIYFIVKSFDGGSSKPNKQPEKMQKKILIIDDHDDLETLLTDEFGRKGHLIKSTEDRDEAVDLLGSEDFDLIITDLDGEHLTASKNGTDENLSCLPDDLAEPRSNIKAFKLCISNYKIKNFTEDELKYFVETILNFKARCVDKKEMIQDLREMIEFEVPSYVSLMHDILGYLMKRVEKSGVVNPETSNLFVALDEAFVNAVKHGNKYNSEKLVRISVEVSKEEARFTIEDEGEGFNVNEIPDPRNPENLFKASGRGVLFIYNIMDEVKYNERGNRLTMIKKSDKKHQKTELS
jgi:serine/threonine-protein kinase RsbW